MEQVWISVFNHIAYNFSFVLLLSFFSEKRCKRLWFFLGVTFVSVLLNSYIFMVMPVFLLLGIGFYYIPKKPLESIFQVATPLVLCIVISLILGSTIGFVTNGLIGETAYNLLIGGVMVLSCVLIARLPKPICRFSKKTLTALVAAELVVITFFSFATLLLSEPSKRSWSVVGLFAVLLFLSVGCLVGQLSAKELALQKTQEESKQQKEFIYLLEQSQQDIHKLKHYYINLYSSVYYLLSEGAFEDAKKCFEDYLIPIYTSQLARQNRELAIDNPLIRSCLANMIGKAEPMIAVELRISKSLYIPPCHTLNLFKIITITVENATTYLAENKLTTLILCLENIGEHTLKFSVTNAVLPTFELAELTAPKAQGHGFGLTIIKDLVREDKTIEFSVEKLDNYLVMNFFLHY